MRPDRTHHCNTCNRCVLLMDHHCPWIGNCVGFYNHKFFIMFCLYAATDCLVVGISFLPALIKLWGNFELEETSPFDIVGCICGISIAISLYFLGILHINLMCKNKTTIETHIIKGRSPYYLGLKKNWDSIFGPSIWKFLLPTMSQIHINPHEYHNYTANKSEDIGVKIEGLA